jgi:hypothetical protein
VRTFFALGMARSPQKEAAGEGDGEGDGVVDGRREEGDGDGDAEDRTGDTVGDTDGFADDAGVVNAFTSTHGAADFDECTTLYPSARTTAVAAAAVQIKSGRRVIR